MSSKIIGGILLIVGTSIGGGMLALPIATASAGFINAALLLFGCWLLMTFCAFLILEVNLWLPQNSNIISMSRVTLGKCGAFIAWLSYLLLFYCLLAAYMSSGADILQHFFIKIGWQSSTFFNTILFVVLLGYIVYRGIRTVDYVNRALMFTKLGAYIVLVSFIIAYVDLRHLSYGKPQYLIASLTLIFTSFGYATLIPSLRSYFKDDIAQLRKVILIGSFIPLLCYIIWILAILGSVPANGENGLIRMLTSGHSTTDIPQALSYYLHNPWITSFAKIFTSVCVATAFLGVALSMADFLADGFKIAKNSTHSIFVYSATFIPPLILSLFYPNAFILGLRYAGIFCAILLILYPALMVWSGRYIKKISKGYQVVGGKSALVLILLCAALILTIGVLTNIT